MAFSDIQEKMGISTRSSQVERELDNAVADSFPASDPVSLAQPHDPEELGGGHPAVPMRTLMWLGGGLLALLAIVALRR